MIEVRQTKVFSKWLRKLSDVQAKARILVRLSRIAENNFGDYKPVGDGVSELRFTFGPGYRVYYTFRGETVVLLLVGGDKASQDADIAKAKALVKELDDG